MMFDFAAFQTGALHFLAAFGMAAVVLIVFKFVYQAVTPYNEMKLIKEGSPCAAVTLSGAMIGFALPVAMSLSQATGAVEFIVWAVLAGVIQIVAFLLVRLLLVKDLAAKIEAGQLSVAIYLAAISITVGLLNAASMTE